MIPTVGSRWFWFKHDRALLGLQVQAVAPNGDVELFWWACLARIWPGEAQQGNITWTRQEWDAAGLKEFQSPVMESDLTPDEVLCDFCHGTRFEITRDSDILSCIWCNFTGRQQRRPEPQPPNRRSPLHPELP